MLICWTAALWDTSSMQFITFLSSTFTPYNRSTGFSIFIYNKIDFYPSHDLRHSAYHHDPMSGCPSPIMNITINKIAQEIMFFNERPLVYASTCPGDNLIYTGIELCEIRVMGIFFVHLSWKLKCLVVCLSIVT